MRTRIFITMIMAMWYSPKNFTWLKVTAVAMAAGIVHINMKMYPNPAAAKCCWKLKQMLRTANT